MTLEEHDVMNLIMKKPFERYMSSAEFRENLDACESPMKPPPLTVSNMVTATEVLTVQEFRRGTKRDKTHYEDLKNDKFFNTWNRGFVATACMHQTDLV
jgi:acid phosphatase class B